MNEDEIGLRVKRLRIEKGLSQQAFGEITGHPQSKISNAERGATPGVDLATAICQAYPNLNARWLLTGEGEMWAGPSAPPGDAGAADSLPIDEMAELGRQGSLGSAWSAVEGLTASYPAFATVARLAELAGVGEDAVRVGLRTLERMQLLEAGATPSGRGWRLLNGGALIRSGDVANINQHGLEALRELTQEIVPATEQGRGVLYAAILHLPGGARELGRAMLEGLRAQCAEHKADAGPESLSILFGVAVKGERG